MLTAEQRNLLATKLADFGNIAAGSLVFGTILRAEAFALGSILIGISILVAAYAFSIVLSRQSS